MDIALSSLVPTVIELTSFVESNPGHFWWYPNWYLGVPFNFLIGPIVPAVLIMLNKLFGQHISLFSLYIGVLLFSLLVGSVGVWWLVTLFGRKSLAVLSACLYCLLPGFWGLLFFSSGLSHIAFSFIPWMVGVWFMAMKSKRQSLLLITIVLITTMLLINSSSLLTILVALISVTLLFDRQEWGKMSFKLGLSLMIAILLATLWYTPRFWLVQAFNPSLGGKQLIEVVYGLIRFLTFFVPLMLAVFFVRKRYIKLHLLSRFVLYFGIGFTFLTLIRFIADPDFYMDWLQYILELQISIAIGGTVLLRKMSYRLRYFVIVIIIMIMTIINGGFINRLLFDKNVTAYKTDIKQIVTSAPAKMPARFFFSGSPVFWWGSVEPRSVQVRGGRDEVVTHSMLPHIVYQIREGTKWEVLLKWLDVLGVTHVLVHGDVSRDPFKDFKNTERFDRLEQLKTENGDTLFRTHSTYPYAYVVKKDMLDLNRPKNALDEDFLTNYFGTRIHTATIANPQPDQIDLIFGSLTHNQIVSVAITYDPAWRLIQGKGTLVKDSLGQTAITAAEPGETVFQLRYEKSYFYIVPTILIVVLMALILVKSDDVYTLLIRRFSVGDVSNDEEREY